MRNNSLSSHNKNNKKSNNNNNNDNHSPNQNNNSNDVVVVEQSPHTLRLLKLIKECQNTQQAEMAAKRLKVVLQKEEENNAVRLWDVLGRLQEYLCSQEWSTRINASLAMEGIAQLLPLEDQYQFLVETGNYHHENDNDNNDGVSNENNNNNAAKEKKEKKSNDSNSLEFLQTSDIDCNTLQCILSKGQILMSRRNLASTSSGGGSISRSKKRNRTAVGTNHNKSRNSQEEQLLEQLDQQQIRRIRNNNQQGGDHPKDNPQANDNDHDNDNDDNNNNGDSDNDNGTNDTFVQQRMRLQRHILAQRLGLSGLMRATATKKQDDHGWINDIILSTTTNTTSSSATTENNNHNNVSNHGRRPNNKNRNKNDDNNEDSNSTIRALLVMQIIQQQQRGDQHNHNHNHNNQSTTATNTINNNNSQYLLATELLYNLFDPCWYIRHGSLLGILALLKGWKYNIHHHHRPTSNDEDATMVVTNNNNPFCFGAWPHDMFLRCFFLLLLDRFEDYSGTVWNPLLLYHKNNNDANTNTTTTNNNNNKHNITGNSSSSTGGGSGSTGIVAPVRELAGQLFSILFLWSFRDDDDDDDDDDNDEEEDNGNTNNNATTIQQQLYQLIFWDLLEKHYDHKHKHDPNPNNTTNDNAINNETTTTTTREEQETKKIGRLELDWEVRHGIFIALKYITVTLFETIMATNPSTTTIDNNSNNDKSNKNSNNSLSSNDAHSSFSSSNNKNHSNNIDDNNSIHNNKNMKYYKEWIYKTIQVSIRYGIGDDNDDVKSVSAQILTHVIHVLLQQQQRQDPEKNHHHHHHCDYYPTIRALFRNHNIFQQLWITMTTKTCDVSSCVLDLVHLFAAIVKFDCSLVLQQQQQPQTTNDNNNSSSSSNNNNNNMLARVLLKLNELVHFHELYSVRLSALEALAYIAEPIAESVFSSSSSSSSSSESDGCNNDNNNKNTSTCATTNSISDAYAIVLKQLFDSYFSGAAAATATNDNNINSNSRKKETGQKGRKRKRQPKNETTSTNSTGSIFHNEDDNNKNKQYCDARRTTWKKLVHFVPIIFTTTTATKLYDLQLCFLLKYFGIHRRNAKNIIDDNDNDNNNDIERQRLYSLTRSAILPNNGQNNNNYYNNLILECHIEASEALAEFLYPIRQQQQQRSSTSMDYNDNILELVLLAFLDSPWTIQCEAACLLYQAVLHRQVYGYSSGSINGHSFSNHGKAITKTEVSLTTTTTTTTTSVQNNANNNSKNNNHNNNDDISDNNTLSLFRQYLGDVLLLASSGYNNNRLPLSLLVEQHEQQNLVQQQQNRNTDDNCSIRVTNDPNIVALCDSCLLSGIAMYEQNFDNNAPKQRQQQQNDHIHIAKTIVEFWKQTLLSKGIDLTMATTAITTQTNNKNNGTSSSIMTNTLSSMRIFTTIAGAYLLTHTATTTRTSGSVPPRQQKCCIIKKRKRANTTTSIAREQASPTLIKTTEKKRTKTKTFFLCCRLPAKITPLVRAIMTSLKNETHSARQNRSCECMATLLEMLSLALSSSQSSSSSVALSSCGSDTGSDDNMNGSKDDNNSNDEKNHENRKKNESESNNDNSDNKHQDKNISSKRIEVAVIATEQQKQQNSRAREKILNNLCEVISSRSSSSLQESNQDENQHDPPDYTAFVQVVRLLIAGVRVPAEEEVATSLVSLLQQEQEGKTLDMFSPIWSRLEPLLSVSHNTRETSDNCLSSGSATQEGKRLLDESKVNVLKSLNLLQAISHGTLQEDNLVTAQIIDTFLPSLLNLTCSNSSSNSSGRVDWHCKKASVEKTNQQQERHVIDMIQKNISSIIKSLCYANFSSTMANALRELIKSLKDQNDDFRRLRACQLLQIMIQQATTSSTATQAEVGKKGIQNNDNNSKNKCDVMGLSPFVRKLLPVVMSTMADPHPDCSKIANNIFSSLVRVAPLVVGQSSTTVSATATPVNVPASNAAVAAADGSDRGQKQQQSHCNSQDQKNINAEAVIDHLIHGKPLPALTLPGVIERSLKRSNISLRTYQMEGISWLRFLQSVNLNGALCDSMGLGKTLQALLGVAISHHDEDETHNNPRRCPEKQTEEAEERRNNCNTKGKECNGSAKEDRVISLVICPSSVVGHWEAEIRKFFSSSDSFVDINNDRSNNDINVNRIVNKNDDGDQSIFRPLCVVGNTNVRKSLWLNELNKCNIVITSYAVLRADIHMMIKVVPVWRFCILDEGHLLKNPKTATARASRLIRAKHKLILTGTPIQNSVHELWATFDFLMPNFLGTSKSFTKEFAKPIMNGLHVPDASAENISIGMETLQVLHQQVLPFILRREKGQVLKELPPKNITIIPCEMSVQQRSIYEQFCRSVQTRKAISALQRVARSLDTNPHPPQPQAPSDENSSSSSDLNLGSDVLRSLLFLRLLCTHPSLVLVETQGEERANKQLSRFGIEASGKLLAISELLRNAGIHKDDVTAADNDTSFLYCNNDDGDDYQNSNDDEFASVLEPDEQTSSLPISSYSTAATTIPEKIESSSVAGGSKCLIFAQFTQSLDVVEECLLRPCMPSLRYLRLDGRVPAEKRSFIVDTFNQDMNIKVMLLTTRVGGLGLNLTGADTVIFLESDYNPFVDLQAMDRAHRIGQKKTVNVYRLVTKDSIEEKIINIQERKMKMSEAIVNTDNSTMFSMGTDRLLDIFTCRSNNTQAEGAEKGKEKLSSTSFYQEEYNLDNLVERYKDDYGIFSIHEFVKNFRV